eukprot:GHVU01110922.1.p1 GENE.GHVU01110922.1~~GHVU01110922.1.p1  ORF type:complete len:310 (-),score=36.21 GHVU01110922.1:424-1353(-)
MPPDSSSSPGGTAGSGRDSCNGDASGVENGEKRGSSLPRSSLFGSRDLLGSKYLSLFSPSGALANCFSHGGLAAAVGNGSRAETSAGGGGAPEGEGTEAKTSALLDLGSLVLPGGANSGAAQSSSRSNLSSRGVVSSSSIGERGASHRASRVVVSVDGVRVAWEAQSDMNTYLKAAKRTMLCERPSWIYSSTVSPLRYATGAAPVRCTTLFYDLVSDKEYESRATSPYISTGAQFGGGGGGGVDNGGDKPSLLWRVLGPSSALDRGTSRSLQWGVTVVGLSCLLMSAGVAMGGCGLLISSLRRGDADRR